MSSKLTNKDYKNILKFYKIDTSTLSTKAIKEKAEHFLAVKLCKCIKNIKVSKKSNANANANEKGANEKGANEKRAIALCYNSVLKKKNLKIFKFTCKKKAKLLLKKGTRKIFVEKLRA
jgi:hypothetical protein